MLMQTEQKKKIYTVNVSGICEALDELQFEQESLPAVIWVFVNFRPTITSTNRSIEQKAKLVLRAPK